MFPANSNRFSEQSSPETLAALSRNASVISTSSSDSGPSLLLRTPRPRPMRTFSSPRSKSPDSHSPRTSRPPPHLARELGYSDTSKDARASSNARSKSRSRNPAVTVKDFEFGGTLGEGSYSTVKKATYLRTGQQYAIKVLDKNHLIRNDKMQIALAEKNALVRLGAGHPGVVRLYYAFHDEWSLYFVLDLAKNGEMQSLISRMGSLSTACAQYYAAQTIDAIDYMHKKYVIHRDLKPENLLLDEAFRIKITDFGTGKILESETDKAKTFVGTAQYVSPELLESNETSRSSDFWALGCIIYQMIAGRFAFQGLSQYLTWQKIKRLEYTFPEGFDEQGKDLVEKLLVLDPTKRLGVGPVGSANDMEALRSHPFFASIKWESLWSDTPPPLESGLIRSAHPLAQGHDQNWEDIGAAWDDLVQSDVPDDIDWASDAEGPEYQFRSHSHSNGTRPEVGPRGETHHLVSPEKADFTVQDTGTIVGSTVETIKSGGLEDSTALRASPLTCSPSSSSEGSPTGRLAALTKSVKLHEEPSPTSSHAMQPENERGRNHVTSPIQGNGPPANINFISHLKLPDGEAIIFNTNVETRSLRRRASRLLPLPTTPSKPKTRQLVLTNRRLLCLKQRHKSPSDISIKSELTLRASEKMKEKDKERESRGIIASVERKSEREFVVLTSTKSYSYAAEDSALVDKWIQNINAALAYHRQ